MGNLPQYIKLNENCVKKGSILMGRVGNGKFFTVYS